MVSWSLHLWHAIQWLQGRYKVSISLSIDLIFSNLIFKFSTKRLAFVTWLPKLRTTIACFFFKVSIYLACCFTIISLWTKLKCMLYVVIDENRSLQCVHGNIIGSYVSDFFNFSGCKILLCSLKTFWFPNWRLQVEQKFCLRLVLLNKFGLHLLLIILICVFIVTPKIR